MRASSELSQMNELANQIANQKAATATDATGTAGNTKEAERPKAAMRNLEQKINDCQIENNKSKRREKEKIEQASKSLETELEEEESEEEESEEEEEKEETARDEL